ncbi:MAG: mevalonate kinase [Anaerolineae bacterium]
MTLTASASAPGKIILFGEHAVVYGQPAIAVPLTAVSARAVVQPGQIPGRVLIVAANLGRTLVVRPEPQDGEHALVIAVRLLLEELGLPVPGLQVTVHSTIPVASGLGSGAAVTTALLRAVAEAVGAPLDAERLNGLVYEVEKLYHGTPSGIDNTVIVYERPVFFVRGEPIETFTASGQIDVLVADTGISSPTRIAVGDVRELVKSQPVVYSPVLEHIGAITREAREAIARGDVAALGALAVENHRLLQQLTVSCEALDRLVHAAIQVGATGAKLSGGGRGGNMIAFVRRGDLARVRDALRQAGAVRVLHTTIQAGDHHAGICQTGRLADYR